MPNPQHSSDKELRSDTVRTRATLIASAERLFAERGIEAVSLSEINKASHQRNKSAVHYHFQSRDGLLAAILEQHRTRIEAKRLLIIESSGDLGEMGIREATSALVWPTAEELHEGKSGEYYLRIMAQVYSNPSLSIHSWMAANPQLPTLRLGEVMARHIGDIPFRLLALRMRQLSNFMFGCLVDIVNQRPKTPGRLEAQLEDLISMMAAMLRAPIHPQTLQYMQDTDTEQPPETSA